VFSKFLSIYFKNMIIRNNKNSFFNLKINKGGVVSTERFAPNEVRNISYLTDLKQISNNIVIRNGAFSRVEEVSSQENITLNSPENLIDSGLELKIAKNKTEEYLKNN